MRLSIFLYFLYSLFIFIYNRFAEYSIRILTYIKGSAGRKFKPILITLIVAIGLIYIFRPAVQVYDYCYKKTIETTPATQTPICSKLMSKLESWDTSLMNFSMSLRQNSLFSKLKKSFPSLEQVSVSLGINYYKLHDREQDDWNFKINQLFQPAVKTNIVSLEKRDGFLCPSINKKAAEGQKQEWGHLVKEWEHPAVYYFKGHASPPSDQIKAIYLSGSSARLSRIKKHINYLKRNKANGIVFDIKDVTGFINYVSDIPRVKKVQGGIRPPIKNLKKLIHLFKKENVYSIARVSLFQDIRLGANFPHLSIKKKNGAYLLTNGRRLWVDPGYKEVQEYNLKIIWEVLESGVDEIQLDYVRYPAEGAWKEASYYNIKSHYEKPAILSKFLRKVYSLCKSYGVSLSLDVFGVMAWQEKLDIKSTGQDLRILAQTSDVVSPMLYPSHFGKVFGDIINPADKPFHFIKEGCARIYKVIPERVHVRPWLQAFKWRVTNYNSRYIDRQVEGAYATKTKGFLLWNAGNTYLDYNDPGFK